MTSRIPAAIIAHRPGGPYARQIGQPNEYEFLYLVPRILNAKVTVEIGTENGNSAAMIGDAVNTNGGTHYTVDIAPCLMARQKIAELGLTNVGFSQADGREFLRAWMRAGNALFDFAFEDSAHTYPYTLEVLRLLDQCVRPGGVIAVHDVGIPAVKRSLDEFLAETSYTWIWTQFGPTVAYLLKDGAA